MTLEQYIEQNILPQYDAFDGGHHHIHSGKILMDGTLYIIRDGKIYNVQGVEVK